MPVEALSKSDLDAIVAIERASYPDPWTRGMLSSALAQSCSNGIKFVQDGQVAGYLIYTLFSPQVEVLNVAVHPLFRRQGIGRKMMEWMVDDARCRGCTEAFLEVRVSNTSAIGLYESFGFTTIHTRRKYYRDGEDGLVMGAKLV